MISVEFPVPPERIKAEATRLAKEIESRRAELEILRNLLTMVQRGCKHPGQQTGYNERDGSWANPCPVCGESH